MRLGRRPARYTRRSLRSALAIARALDPLGPAPTASNNYIGAVTVPWGMLGNDSVGDCTIADSGHQIMLHTANAGTIVVPTTDDILAAYSAATGYNPGDSSTDQGADELSVCEFMKRTGILGHRSDDYGNVDPSQEDHIKWTVQLFGACRIGVNLPQSAMDLSKPWDVGGNETILGGHDVPIVDYRDGLYTVVTWGQLVKMTPAFLAKFVDEAHAELYFDWIRAQGAAPNGFSLDQLAADLRSV